MYEHCKIRTDLRISRADINNLIKATAEVEDKGNFNVMISKSMAVEETRVCIVKQMNTVAKRYTTSAQ